MWNLLYIEGFPCNSSVAYITYLSAYTTTRPQNIRAHTTQPKSPPYASVVLDVPVCICRGQSQRHLVRGEGGRKSGPVYTVQVDHRGPKTNLAPTAIVHFPRVLPKYLPRSRKIEYKKEDATR